MFIKSGWERENEILTLSLAENNFHNKVENVWGWH
jgi:hypothetical protein